MRSANRMMSPCRAATRTVAMRSTKIPGKASWTSTAASTKPPMCSSPTPAPSQAAFASMRNGPRWRWRNMRPGGTIPFAEPQSRLHGARMFQVAALYRFASFDDPAALRQPLLDLCAAEGVTGTLLLAGEGINGTIAGTEAGIAAVLGHIRGLPDCAELPVKFSTAADMPFQRMKVRLKKEIVTMKVPGLDPARDAAPYVDPADWNALVDDPDTILIDTRNGFEVGYGSFDGAVDPATKSFGEFPDWWRANAEKFAGKRVP